ncbi:Oidioi.mRNA.OKI2018_I69.XSR.g13442.t1.cds [Oikopleura dioica]|uniref:NEDD8-activating enzyme E1 regulatory subunit n=1 Tax=Oikopleura dioica TaxID=34765 RepID=A0ABN7SAM2_OIKDI|nr:Oidioi.mRNA.OKI2018_I69.XSR.g13442.t1.cds [Oikopleura dioica]
MPPVHEMCDSPVQQDIRYDRQIRLWGDHGQTALENAHVLVCGVTTTSCETVKSLILPGVGKITLIDHKVVEKEDISSNFFLTKADLGRNRAEAVLSNISELNPSVKVSYDDRNVADVLASGDEFFKKFTVVLVSKIDRKVRRKIEKLLYPLTIPVVLVESTGMFGRIRLLFKEHFVLEARNEHQVPDLRLDNPFPELGEYLQSFDLEKIDDCDHKHVPMIVPLFLALEEWRNENDRRMPDYKGKKAIREKINRIRRSPDEENFDEAIAAVNSMIYERRVPTEIGDFCCEVLKNKSLTPDTPIHWVMFKALHDFINKTNKLPQDPTIPDMFSDSKSFVRLAKLYRDKAQEDVELFKKFLQHHCSSIGIPSPDEKFITRFCSNARGLRVMFCDLDGFENTDPELPTKLPELLQSNEDNLHAFLCFEAALDFEQQFSRHPGTDYEQMLDGQYKDADRLNFFSSKITKALDSSFQLKEDYIDEFLRICGLELNSIATYTGGLAAQETIKLITRQFIPIENTAIYNGITEELQTFVL